MRKTTPTADIFIDPVCLMNVDPGKKNLSFTHRMRTYHFCAEACCKAFEANPEKYLEQKPSKRKGWWGRYLERLNKATGGRPPKCCQ
ncbi:MAG: YHS domain-containing protein [Pseudomonadota bacterium]